MGMARGENTYDLSYKTLDVRSLDSTPTLVAKSKQQAGNMACFARYLPMHAILSTKSAVFAVANCSRIDVSDKGTTCKAHYGGASPLYPRPEDGHMRSV